MAKVRLQWKLPKEHAVGISDEKRKSFQYDGVIDVFKKAFRDDGVKGLYKGVQTQIFKAVLCQAILFMVKERVSSSPTFRYRVMLV